MCNYWYRTVDDGMTWSDLASWL